MSDLERAVEARVADFRPHVTPPFDDLLSRRRRRARGYARPVGAFAATAAIVVAGAVTMDRQGSSERPGGRHSQPSASTTTAVPTSLADRFARPETWTEPWLKNGREVPRDEIVVAVGPEHCDWQGARFLYAKGLDAPRDDRSRMWARDPEGVLEHFPRAEADFRAQAVLPDDAAFTGYSQGPVEVWTAPSDAYDYVYLVNAHDRSDVERWVRGGGGCA